jgi:prevent-host-death family protein
MRIGIHEAKTHLSKYLARVEAGESITLCRGEVPIARLVPYRQKVETTKSWNDHYSWRENRSGRAGRGLRRGTVARLGPWWRKRLTGSSDPLVDAA